MLILFPWTIKLGSELYGEIGKTGGRNKRNGREAMEGKSGQERDRGTRDVDEEKKVEVMERTSGISVSKGNSARTKRGNDIVEITEGFKAKTMPD